jgi:mono/diheme cytochrome c family protein
VNDVRRAGARAGIALLLGASLFAAVGCGSDGSDSNDAAPDGGAALYATNCASCHGEDLRGTDKGPPHLSVVYEPSHHPDESFRRAIEQGVQAHHWDFGDMAPVTGLDAPQVDAIISYIREVQTREGFEPYPPGQ